MNERIRELASQATKQVTKPDGHYIVQEWQQVFAELIVKECCDIFVELRTRPADLAVKDVKKHFGVEE